jgi:hypothetical protein
MNILRYDTDNISYKDLVELTNEFHKRNIDVIVMPKDVDVLLDCDSATLYWAKAQIEEAIRKKEIMN